MLWKRPCKTCWHHTKLFFLIPFFLFYKPLKPPCKTCEIWQNQKTWALNSKIQNWRAKLKFWLWSRLFGWCWSSHFIAVGLRFLICKMRQKRNPKTMMWNMHIKDLGIYWGKSIHNHVYQNNVFVESCWRWMNLSCEPRIVSCSASRNYGKLCILL